MKRKSKEPVEVPYKQRRTTRLRRSSIEILPNELIYIIFSHLDVQTLFYVVRLVCKKWYHMAMSPILWKRIRVTNDVPTNILTKWIESSGLLRELSMENRNDANIMTEIVSKNCKELERIKLINCWGSTLNPIVRSGPLCHLITRCQKINNLNFARTKFSSCKFFSLLSKIKISGKVTKHCCYYGPINSKQIKALLVTLKDYEVQETATIGNCNIRQMLKLIGINDYVDGAYNNNGDILEDICANLFFVNDNNPNSLQINI